MICSVCYGMLRGHQGSQWRGTFDLHFDHQIDRRNLKESAGMSCVICRSLLTELSRLEEKNRKGVIGKAWNDVYASLRRTAEWLRLKQLGPEERGSFISAYLSEIYGTSHGQNGLYRLDFKLGENKKRVGTFVLQRVDLKTDDPEKAGSVTSHYTEDASTSTLHTPFSSSTSSDEVLSLARNWIRDCSLCHDGCPHKTDFDSWYPSRLIDLGVATEKNERTKSDEVRLVSTKELLENGPLKDRFYVTLSHCWGKAKFTTLTEDNIDQFLQRGIKINTLPRTFRDAIYFARRLSKQVRYIWIDSLCIIQGHSPKQYEDWLRESAQMYQIYYNSYCNISATAATDSEKGLFFRREPRELWEDDINLNVEGIPGKGQPWQQELMSNPLDPSDPMPELPEEPLSMSVGAIHGETEKQRIERCRILDVSFWERHVDDAPVNRRGWVLQERLMAPRVLHFCQSSPTLDSKRQSLGGQVAWECRELVASESARTGLPIFRVQAGDIVPGGKVKSLIPHNPTQRNPFLDPATPATLYTCWKQIVEVYSKTRLTNAEDKLIALSGIASMMYDQINDNYLAGMWQRYLASQLLWYVDPVFEDGRFYYMSERPTFYRAPSWSWAAIDAPHGVKCGEITDVRFGEGRSPHTGQPTDEGLRIEIIEVEVTPGQPDNKFGLIKDPSTNSGVLNVLKLRGVVKKIELQELKVNGVTRYGWYLVTRSSGIEAAVEVAIHRNVYLDSPDSDTDILGPNGQVYCLPARKDAAGYLMCLLLQLERKDGVETGRFGRIGLTKIPPYEGGQEKVLALSAEDDDAIPHGNWHAQEKKHTIEIV
ncbi:uncharacterized protein PAC_13168 [Phialocephala subalpina]|uniref:Heterokaryon incompatibility domain-containing protein n=1 Tax=Phialocephala subalpina TaxID=576137 RepID=A0A1L7XE20_9HELO|nr:uncharacterized protein PAC_13168 [Phialocephala subalpina]